MCSGKCPQCNLEEYDGTNIGTFPGKVSEMGTARKTRFCVALFFDMLSDTKYPFAEK